MGQEISQQNQRQHCTKLLNSKSCKQNFQKQKVCKTLSTHSSSSTDSSSGYQTTSTTSGKIKPILLYDQVAGQSSTPSQSTGSGVYYSSYYCSTSGRSSASITSSALSTASSSSSSKSSSKSLDKQKNYLNHHLYIKSYLDIVEEDEKAKEHFQPARPGIRNYTPKILAEKKRSGSSSNSKKDEIWI